MKNALTLLSVSLLSTLSLVATADSKDSSPKGPDFSVAPPTHKIDPSLAASDGTRPIMPSDVIGFRKDSDVVSPAALSQITQTALWMKQHPDQRLVIEGHTDKLGRKAFNEDLATRRAAAVRDQLMLRGVKSDRVVLEIFGEVGGVGKVNELERAVVLTTSLAASAALATEALEERKALSVTWTDNGTLFTETLGEHQAAMAKRVGTK